MPQAMENLEPEVCLHLILLTCVVTVPELPNPQMIERRLYKTGQFIFDLIYFHDKVYVRGLNLQ